MNNTTNNNDTELCVGLIAAIFGGLLMIYTGVVSALLLGQAEFGVAITVEGTAMILAAFLLAMIAKGRSKKEVTKE